MGTTDTSIAVDEGEKRLHELGYKQELKREMNWFSNFAISFSIISVITGITTLYSQGLTYGGPVSMTWGWPLVSFFTLIVGLSMAEITSAFPTSGGLYFWSSRLAGRDWAPFASWATGWFNLVGQVAVTAGIDFGLALVLSNVILLATGTALNDGVQLSRPGVVALYAGILVVHALLNTFAVNLLSILAQISVYWHIILTILLIILVPAVAPTTQPSSYVWTTFTRTEDSGLPENGLYVFLLGLLMSQYTISGYDASAHMTEETLNAPIAGPTGIISSIVVSFVFGWGLILAVTYSIQDPSYVLSPDNETGGGYAVGQIFYDAFNARYGSGTGGTVLLALSAVAVFFCGLSSVASNSRMIYAFSRDGALPGSSLWHRIHPTLKTPIYAVWFSAFLSFLLGLPYLKNTTAFTAITSISTIGLYISYVIPTFLRITVARTSFTPGPFNLGRFSYVVGTIAVIWVMFITVLFCLPTVYPIDVNLNFNYASIAIGGITVFIVGYWLLSARFWFKGPVRNVTEESFKVPTMPTEQLDEEDAKEGHGMPYVKTEM